MGNNLQNKLKPSGISRSLVGAARLLRRNVIHEWKVPVAKPKLNFRKTLPPSLSGRQLNSRHIV